MEIQPILDSLLADLGASRVTLRQRTTEGADAGFPITHECLAPEAESIRDVRTPNMAGQPVVLLVTKGQQVVQDDCAAEFTDDEPYQTMLELYGGMKAQIVTPLVVDGQTQAIVSLHELKTTRTWSDADRARCSATIEALRPLLAGGEA